MFLPQVLANINSGYSFPGDFERLSLLAYLKAWHLLLFTIPYDVT